jgi:hypothetical protein
LSISAIDRAAASRRARRTTFAYAGATAFCILFSQVYALLGHGVRSALLSLMFFYPLLGGVLPFGLLWLLTGRRPSDGLFRLTGRPGRLAGNLYHSGLATLTLASALGGILAIAGTASPYLLLYEICGGALLLAGILTDVCRPRRHTRGSTHES